MRILCYCCGKSVSSELPDSAVLRATAICPECLELANQQALELTLQSIRTAIMRKEKE